MKTQRTILSPSEFAWFQLGMKSLYDWQIEVLEAIGLQEHGGPPVAVAAANGSGKTSNIVAPEVCPPHARSCEPDQGGHIAEAP